MAITKLTNVYGRNVDGSTNYGQFLGREWQTSYTGKVLRVYRADYRAMSDVYTVATFAEVWESGKRERIMVNANFECDQSEGFATVDATADVLLDVQVADAAAEIAESARVEALRLKAAEDAAKRPDIGRMVRVFKGRKVPVGTTGRVFWSGIDGYGNRKVGISPSGVMVGNKYTDALWTAASNCEAI